MELTETQRAFLDRPLAAVLATRRADGATSQSVVWYRREGDTVWISAAPDSLKARHLRRDPRLSLLVLAADGMSYLALAGTATITEDVQTPDRLRLLDRYLGADGARAYVASHPQARPNARIHVHVTRAVGYNLDA
jgi:PPOX class probable F420-dependent enzyme